MNRKLARSLFSLTVAGALLRGHRRNRAGRRAG